MCRQACWDQFDRNHAFRLGDSAWGVQFPPEFDAATIRSYFRSRSYQIVADGQHPAWLSEKIWDTLHSAGLLGRYFNVVKYKA